MANSDYINRNITLSYCPAATLLGDIGPGDTIVFMLDYESSRPDGIVPGMALMIGGEVCVLIERIGNALTIGRGCGDTIPAAHEDGTTIWFFGAAIGSDEKVYAATETIAVKLLPRTASGGTVLIENSPPNDLTFDWRFARPYPPGKVIVNGDPWFTGFEMDSGAPSLQLTWAHRDRVLQHSELVDHQQGDVGPEVGTTYVIRVHRPDGSTVRTVTGITGKGYVYNWPTAVEDFETTTGTQAGFITLASVRDGLESWQKYRINFEFDGSADFTTATQDLALTWTI